MRAWFVIVAAACAAACGHAAVPAPVAAGDIVATMPDGSTARLIVRGDRIAEVATAAGATTHGFAAPPVIDSHVHLAYWAVADKLAAAGVEGVVDLAAPEGELPALAGAPIHVLAAGPMLTHDGGYPLDAWGADGYGAGCHDAACVTATVDRLAGKGVRVIKLALDDDGLAPALVPAAVAAAHAHGLKVAAHALSDASARLAGLAGVDVLAHTPVEPLADDTVAAWRGKAVISTLAAFGGSDTAVANLRKLRAAGCTVLYGTDMGNARVAGPNPEEIALMARAGMDGAAIADAMTTVPARFWGFDFGVAAGNEATFVVLARDPHVDPAAYVDPEVVYVRGLRVGGQ
jgi:imidazolonepropionase-like amidohydrolase